MNKGRFYPRMALVNLARNGQFYIPYLLTVMGTAAAYYITLALAATPDLPQTSRYSYLTMFMSIGTFVIAVFAVIFLTYTNSFLMKRRKRELGLYNVLGMGKRHIAIVLGFETLYTAFAGIIGGAALGMLLQKLAMLLLCRMMRMDIVYGFYVSGSAIAGTAILFGVILLFNLLLNLHRIHVQNPMELLRESSAGEREPKTRWPLAVIGVAALGAGYAIAVTTRSAMMALGMYFIAVLLVIIGTYCLFTSVSIAVLKALRANKKFYYQTDHFIGVSGMLYRMKRNAVGLANICILSTMVLVMVSGTLSLYLGSEAALDEQFAGNLRAEVRYDPAEETPFDSAALSAIVSKQLEQQGVSAAPVAAYRYLSFNVNEEQGALEVKKYLSGSSSMVCAMTPSDYAAITGAETPSLADGQMLLFTDGAGQRRNLTFRFAEATDVTLTAAEPDSRYPAPRMFQPSAVDVFYLVVSNGTFQELYVGQQTALGEAGGELMQWNGFWNVDESAVQPDELEQTLDFTGTGSWARLDLDTRSSFAQEYYSLNGGFFFLGVFLGAIFLMAAVLIIYYKQISEGYEDRERYLVMQKVGMEPRTVRRSVNTQLLVVFFAPLAVAAIHVAFDFSLMTRLLTLFSLHNGTLTLLCTAGTLAVFGVIYALVYRVTARAYYKLVKA
ncbi:ABC transporter permease protein YxdM [anaerobic digester metagenome]|uniref:FtsX-like permease family protein n=1 Tax=Oscillibacter ruminantium TaxID=1263547 RepID=UPI002B204843|nr:ABC transporter permease [Oscillibacter ruminantium]MEA5041935.1 ABC transporter permease [Oscillibacter ruminantium]